MFNSTQGNAVLMMISNVLQVTTVAYVDVDVPPKVWRKKPVNISCDTFQMACHGDIAVQMFCLIGSSVNATAWQGA